MCLPSTLLQMTPIAATHLRVPSCPHAIVLSACRLCASLVPLIRLVDTRFGSACLPPLGLVCMRASARVKRPTFDLPRYTQHCRPMPRFKSAVFVQNPGESQQHTIGTISVQQPGPLPRTCESPPSAHTCVQTPVHQGPVRGTRVNSV